MGTRALVTGAAGFIGSHVVDALLARGDVVVGLDNFDPYYDPNRKRANVAESRELAPPGAEYTFVEGDIRDGALLRRLFEEHSPDFVIHMAAMAGVRASVDDPFAYYDVNLTGTLNLLEVAREATLGNFVLASTSSVYGETQTIPFVEDEPCDRPLAPYPASKRAAEMLGHAYHHLHGLSFTAVRLFTVYGPRGRPDMMTIGLLDNMFVGRKLTLYDGGNMHRDWTFVADIVQGLVAAADRPLGYEVVNIGRGAPESLSNFIAEMERQAGRKATLDSAPRPAADVPYTWADITKARRLLGYEPKHDVVQGIAQTWAWYRSANPETTAAGRVP